MASPLALRRERASEPQDFSLVLGGPLYQLLRRAHITGDALELVRRRTIVIALLAWLPLLAALGSGRTGAGRERGRPVPAGRGRSRPLPGGAAAAHRRGAGGAPAHALRGEAVPGAQADSRERLEALRGRHRIGVSPAQLGARRAAADRLRLPRRCLARLAPLHERSPRPRGTRHRRLAARRSRSPGGGTAT